MTKDVRCPVCGSETTLRTMKKGPDAGKKFHVCNRYPACKCKISPDDRKSIEEDFSLATGIITEPQKDSSENQQQDLWYQQFDALFIQADSYLSAVLSRDFQGLSEDFKRILKAKLALEPVRDSVNNLPNTKNGNYRNIRKDFEKLLDACIKAGEMCLKSIEDDMRGARTAARVHDASVRDWLAVSSQYYESLRRRLDSLSGSGRINNL